MNDAIDLGTELSARRAGGSIARSGGASLGDPGGPRTRKTGSASSGGFRSGHSFIRPEFRLVSSPLMSENRRSAAGEGPREILAPSANHSPWYVVPIAGAVSLTLGLSTALDSRVLWGSYAPVLLVILGIGALVIGFARPTAWRLPPSAPAVPPDRSNSEAWVICPSCSERGIGAVSAPAPTSFRDVRPSRSAAASGRSRPDPSDPADVLWGSWVPEAGRLPAELIGPVPESAYVSHRPGTPSLVEDGEPTIFVPDETDRSAEDLFGSAFGGRDLTANESLAIRATHGSDNDPTANPRDRSAAVSRGVGPSAPGFMVGNVVLWEALNPTPPHLRTGPKRTEAPPARRPSRSRDSGRSVRCATCNSPVGDPAIPSQCPDCLRPLCAQCADGPRRADAESRCSRCSELRTLDALESEVGRR